LRSVWISYDASACSLLAPKKIKRVGLVSLGFDKASKAVDGSKARTFQIEYRYSTSQASAMEAHARDLLALKPEVLVAVGTGPTAAAQRATGTIPIVFIAVSDPIGSGFVSSLARPGGNMTGMLNFEASIAGKWMTMLKEINRGLTMAALLGNPRTTPFDYFCKVLKLLHSAGA
jgi:putative ABC transport system substrate-binding protein